MRGYKGNYAELFHEFVVAVFREKGGFYQE